MRIIFDEFGFEKVFHAGSLTVMNSTINNLAYQLHFEFSPISVEVMKVKTDFMKLSEDYQVIISIKSNECLPMGYLLNTDAILRVKQQKNIHLLLVQLSFTGFDISGFYYEGVFFSPIHKMDFCFHQRVFKDIDTRNLLEKLWVESGFSIDKLFFVGDCHFHFSVIIQYNESNLHFFHRILARSGFLYMMESDEYSWRMIIVGHDFENINIIHINFFNLRIFIEHERKLIFVHTTQIDIYMGQLIVLIDSTELKETFKVIGIKIDRENNEECFIEVMLIPINSVYKLSLEKYKNPLSGIQLAKIMAVDAEVANLDEEGKYEIAYYFSDNFPNEFSSPLRVKQLQSFIGENYGFHYPLQKDQDIMIIFEEGDMEKPYILGAMVSQKSQSLVNKKNKMQHIIRSFAGHELILNDKLSAGSIELNTPYKAQLLRLNDQGRQPGIFLTNNVGDIFFEIGNQIEQKIGNDYKVMVGVDHHTTIGQAYGMNSAGDITIQAEGSIAMQSTQQNSWQSSQDIQFNADQYVSTIQGDYWLESKEEAIYLLAENGQLYVTAGESVLMSSAVQFKVGASRLTVTSSGGELTGRQIILIGEP